MEQDEYQKLAKYCNELLPGFDQGDMIKSISILIWQVSVLHTTEHLSYYNLSMVYGFTDLRRPVGKPFPLSAVSGFNRFKFRCFLKVFGTFNPSEFLDQKLSNIQAYGFKEGSEEQQIAEKFASDLKILDNKLKEEKRAVLDLEKMVQSVCF